MVGRVAAIRASHRSWAMLALVLAGTAGMRSYQRHAFLDPDEAWYALSGEALLRGGVPFRDIQDVKGPIIWYVNALALKIRDADLVSVRLAASAAVLATQCLLFSMGRRWFSPAAGLWAALLYGTATLGEMGQPANTELFAAVPIVAMFYVADIALARRTPVLAAVAGVAGAVALGCRHLAVFEMAACAWFLYSGARARGVVRRALVVVVFAGAAALMAAAAGYWLYRAGALGDAVECLFGRKPIAWLHAPASAAVKGLGTSLKIVWHHAPMWALGLTSLAPGLTQLGGEDGPQEPLDLSRARWWFVAALCSASVTGAFWKHYFLPLFAPLALAGGATAAGLAAHLGPTPRLARGVRAFVRASLAVAVVAPIGNAAAYYYQTRDVSDSEAECRAVGLRVHTLARPSDTVYAWGPGAAQIHFWSRLPLASSLPSASENLDQAGVLDGWEREVTMRPPTWFVIAASPLRQQAAFGQAPFLAELLARRYALRQVCAQWAIYRLSEPS